MRRLSEKQSLILYLALANGLTWLGWIPFLVVASQQGYMLPVVENYQAFLGRSSAGKSLAGPGHVVLALAFRLAVYGPLVAAIVATLVESGTGTASERINRLFGRVTKWRVAGRWYARALWIPVCIALVPMLFGALTGLAPLDVSEALNFLLYLIPIFLLQVLTSGLGEEPGWRGYLWPRLQARFPGEKAIWVAGVIWAVWHYPLTIYYALPQLAGAPFFAAVITVLTMLAGQTMSLIGMTFIYVWMYTHTGSLMLVIIFHALSNTFTTLVQGGGGMVMTLLMAFMPWVVVFILERWSRRDMFPGVTDEA